MTAQALDIQHTETQPASFSEVPAPYLSPDQMAYQLIRSGADFQSVREMVALAKEIATDKARNAFNEAVALAKAEIPVISKNAKGHNNKTYANFAAYAAVVDPIIAKHGLRYRFKTEQADRITVTCVLSHKDGHSEENSLSGPTDTSGNKNAIQAIGSTLTYLQRYTLIQALGLAASDDDDGQSHDRPQAEPERITAEQLQTIRRLIEETETDIVKFCELGGIEALPDMLAKDFPDAVRLLEQKKKRKAK
ncbi:ERF family protein [Brucella sp. IR073]|uniref:ERF family protein n=1 Tax=unclassified Brucella TaxID=2632610 RepID=UPI003B987909